MILGRHRKSVKTFTVVMRVPLGLPGLPTCRRAGSLDLQACMIVAA